MFWCSAEISGLWLRQPLAAVPFPFAWIRGQRRELSPSLTREPDSVAGWVSRSSFVTPGGIANCAEAFGSASPLQLAKMEEFYVGARLSTNSVHSVFPLDNVTWRREGATSCRGPFAGLQYFPQALDARSHRELLLISFACSEPSSSERGRRCI